MSEIKALEKLCAYSRNIHGEGFPYECSLLHQIADAIQTEVDERFMELPVDADGVPIRAGDEVTYGVGQKPHYVYAVSDDAAWLNNSTTVDVIALMEFQAEKCRHVKPRTLEDVLQDLEGMRGNGRMYEDVVMLAAQYAAEIRELLGVDA